jgi:HAD superfamily hydrolase (TIGR01509 family)
VTPEFKNACSSSSAAKREISLVGTALKGVIFDLDGTLADTKLDFEAMRRDLGFPREAPILEEISRLASDEDRRRSFEILDRHEIQGANIAVPMPGADLLVKAIAARGLKMAIFTRNSRKAAEITMGRLNFFGFSCVISREDAKPKPDPEGLIKICTQWGVQPAECIYVGDWHFDVRAGNAAGMKTVLYTDENHDFAKEASVVVKCLKNFTENFDSVVQRKLGFATG